MAQRIRHPFQTILGDSVNMGSHVRDWKTRRHQGIDQYLVRTKSVDDRKPDESILVFDSGNRIHRLTHFTVNSNDFW
jgi:hypothetical protein